MEVNLEWILRLVLFGIGHWILAFMMLEDLANRRRVLGRVKWVWAVLIIFVFFFGSLLYIFCHPQAIVGRKDRDGY